MGNPVKGLRVPLLARWRTWAHASALSAGVRYKGPRILVTMLSADDRLWTLDDVARFLGVHRKTVRKMNVPRTFIETTRQAKRRIVRYIPSEVKEWAAQRSSARFTTERKRRLSA